MLCSKLPCIKVFESKPFFFQAVRAYRAGAPLLRRWLPARARQHAPLPHVAARPLAVRLRLGRPRIHAVRSFDPKPYPLLPRSALAMRVLPQPYNLDLRPFMHRALSPDAFVWDALASTQCVTP